MKLSDFQSKITDLQLRIDDLGKSTLDPKDALAAAIKELSNALDEMDIAQKEQCQQDENQQLSHLAVLAECQHYLRLFNFAPDGCVVTDLKGMIKEANIAASNLLQSKLIGLPLAAFWGEEYLDDLETNLDCLKRGEVIRDWEVRMQLPDGTPVLVSISASVILDIQQKPSCLSWLIHDMTGHTKVEEALRDSEDMYRLLVENANEAIVVVQEGILKFVNPKVVEVTGYSKMELESKQITELIHPDDRQMVMENLLKKLKGEWVPAPYTFRVIDKRGDIRWAEVNPVKISWRGSPATLNFLNDITERKRAEESLKKSEEKYREVFENAAVGIFQTSIQGRLLVANSALTKMFGFASPEEMTADVADLGTQLYARSEDRERLKRLLVEHDRVDNFEVEGRKKDGRSIWISINIHATRDHNGAILHLEGTGIDITERKRAEEALQESEHRYATTLASIGDAVIATDIGGKITFMNKVAEELTGWTLEESLARSAKAIFNIINEFTRQEVDDPITKVLENGSIVGLANHTILIRGDGTEVAIDDSGAPIKDRDGNITGVVLVFRDITERRRMEEALRIQNQTFSEVLNGLDALVYLVDMKTYEIVFINTYGQSIWGDITGKICWQTLQEDQARPCEFCTNSQLIGPDGNPTEGVAWEFQNTVNKRWYDCRDKAIYWPDGRIVRMEIATDITERKRAEEALRTAHDGLELRVKERTSELEARNAEMERFIYTVSHELRSPLISTGGLVGFLKIDLEMGDANRTETDLRLIESAVIKMDQLLTEILELSRIGRVANPPVDVPFGEIVREALNQEVEKLKSRAVEVSVASDLPKVHVDRMRIMEVLVNLIENSIKYLGDQPRPRIEVGHRLDGDQTVFIVRDNGIGIDPSQQDKVFGLFYKVDGKSEGTGVGLALVKRIIEVHGGRIWIESELGKGCTVCFTLPLA
jgi:PAS domain S-box-containing protein